MTSTLLYYRSPWTFVNFGTGIDIIHYQTLFQGGGFSLNLLNL
jgi:hypothetical protein